MSTMTESVFTKIIKRQLPATIHYEDDEFIVIANNDPKAPVHILVIPKKAYANLEEASIDDQGFHARLLVLCRKMAKKMDIADNYQIHINVGRQVQQVQHLHVHVLGGWTNLKHIKAII